MGWERDEQDGGEPAGGAEEREERVRVAAGEAEGEGGGVWCEGVGEVGAGFEGAVAEGDGGEEGGEDGHDGVARVARREGGGVGGGVVDGRFEVVGHAEEDVADEA